MERDTSHLLWWKLLRLGHDVKNEEAFRETRQFLIPIDSWLISWWRPWRDKRCSARCAYFYTNNYHAQAEEKLNYPLYSFENNHWRCLIAEGPLREDLPGIPSIVDTIWRHSTGDREYHEVPTRTGKFTGRSISVPLRTLDKCHVCSSTMGLRVCNSCASVIIFIIERPPLTLKRYNRGSIALGNVKRAIGQIIRAGAVCCLGVMPFPALTWLQRIRYKLTWKFSILRSHIWLNICEISRHTIIICIHSLILHSAIRLSDPPQSLFGGANPPTIPFIIRSHLVGLTKWENPPHLKPGGGQACACTA